MWSGRGHDDSVNVFLLLQHLAIVGITLGLGDQVVLQMQNRFEAPLGFLRFRRGHRGAGIARVVDMALQVGSVRIQPRKVLVRVAPVHIAERHDVLAGQIDQIAAAHAAHARRTRHSTCRLAG